ncbi:ABC transporter permease [Crocosphaera sp.]|uniref:ABC transporter permease n=1 Tax=Crocosphaera sp. TaxID=2729996 RepID=UPI002603DC39|nr:ABC transporter permease [Crocosphaera sp.]MDJ0578607.1 ABC transporter permease [Crocosphaera sp.]
MLDKINNLIYAILAIIMSLIVGAILIILIGKNPLEAYSILFQESLFNYYGFANTLSKTSPLLLSSLGILIALKGGQFNIGGEGQIYLGALGSTLVGLFIKDIPSFLHIILTLMFGFVLGALWGLIPGFLKAYRGINEVITTLLLNYIAIDFISYLVNHSLAEANAPSAYSPLISESAKLPIILPKTLAHAGIFVGIIAMIIVGILLQKTILGYEIEVVGINPKAATYGGISVSKIIILVMALSGGLCGLAGGTEVMGLKYRLFENFSPGYGFNAVAIAFLSRGNVFGVLLTSLFFGALLSGANIMQRSVEVPVTIVTVIQGLTLLLIGISSQIQKNQN